LVVGALPDFATWRGAVCVDALFGTGLDRELTGPARAWVEAFERAAGPKLCVDIPSGLHGDTGQVLGAACRGDVTVTFVAKKRGMTIGAGPVHCGRIVIAGLGLP
ncbi:MAG: bifunctional ADP-dependent NAD(P)H-hydrate dehydratase/NAD(P)H-hydrate epimerase, partial [Planctomycetes bacterium]|nr:bifunctional ADP-dependent NAD(P)H-hydrate dehydratase/NAD(P)H-hydrate epimerase [Planctomycetota bacterium]